jgi:DeoR/GlpR family transcriptional regulator of sugar metabolism
MIFYDRFHKTFRMKTNNSLSSTERQNQIIQLLSYNQRITITEICATFGVSQPTARRDLDALVSSKKIQRVHGGAIPLVYASPEIPLLVRREEQAESKWRIGQAAADLVRDGETIVLGSGSTVLQVALYLKNRRNLTVITNSLKICSALSENTNIKVIQVGGTLNNTSLSFVGNFTQEGMKRYFADKAFISCRGISLQNGITDGNEFQAEVRKTMLLQGQYRYLIADSTKFAKTAFALIDNFTHIDAVVTDKPLSGAWMDFFNAKNIEIICCEEMAIQSS